MQIDKISKFELINVLKLLIKVSLLISSILLTLSET